MKTLVKKMRKVGVLKFQMVLGAIVMIAAMIALPASIIIGDPSIILNPYVLGVVLIGMLMLALFAYFLFMRPYFLYRNSPEVLVETDGKHLYIHGKKEAKIPLADLDGTSYFIHFPFLYSNEFVATLVTHLLSEKYGDLDLDIPGYGSYKLRFVSDVYATANELMAFINQAINN